jgi:sigma-B regulation protein RsbU (phosphoserine phosphatase)
MLALIEKISDQPAHVIAERLFEAVDHFSEGHAQDDDQTLIVIKGVD